MNHSYVNYGNGYIVSDETGKMKVVNMDNRSIKARDIFDAENKLEILNLEFDDCKKKYDSKCQDLILGRIMSFSYIIFVPILFYFLSPVLPIKTIIEISGGFALCYKLFSICCFGTLIGGLKEKKNLLSRINVLEKEIPSLEKKLDKMKKEIHYNDETIEVLSNTDNHSYNFDKIENNSIESSLNGEYSFDKTDNKPKVYVLSNSKNN